MTRSPCRQAAYTSRHFEQARQRRIGHRGARPVQARPFDAAFGALEVGPYGARSTTRRAIFHQSRRNDDSLDDGRAPATFAARHIIDTGRSRLLMPASSVDFVIASSLGRHHHIEWRHAQRFGFYSRHAYCAPPFRR